MKWGSEKNRDWDKEEHKAKTVFYWIATAVLIIAIVCSVLGINYISWKEAVGLIKKQIPTQYGPHALYEGGGMDNLHYTPLWQGPLRGEVSLASDSDFNLRTFQLLDNTMQLKGNYGGHFDGVIKGFSGIYFFLEKKSDFLFYGEKDVKNRDSTKHVQMWVYLLNKGEKTYNKKVWTKWYKNATIGIVYKIDGKTYLRTVKGGYFYNCHGGNITFGFWK